jgi:nicotinamidase-related amidase
MQQAFGLTIPQTLEEVCAPERLALVVYDMQVGVMRQIAAAAEITRRAARLVEAARAGGFRVFYTRHMSAPVELAGVSQLRTAMAWQHVDDVAEVKPSFPAGSPQFELVPELSPLASEMVLDKITFSCFVGTPLDLLLRDCRIDAVAIAGAAIEVGIEPTVRHAIDLGYLPIIVRDACGAGDENAAERSLAGLATAGGSLQTDAATISELLEKGESR